MNRYLPLLLLLLPGYVLGQNPNVPLKLDWSGYYGNPIAHTIPLARSDSGKVILPTATYGKNSLLLLPVQPVIVWRNRDSVAIQFPTTPLSLPQSNGWVEIRINGLIRFAGDLSISKNPQVSKIPVAVQYVTIPASQTVTDALSGRITALQTGKVDVSVYNSFVSAQNATNVQTSTDVLNRLLSSIYNANLTTQNSRDNGQDTQIAGKLPVSFTTTQAATDAAQNTDIGNRVLSSTYATNRGIDQALTAAAQNTANAALPVATYATDQVTRAGNLLGINTTLGTHTTQIASLSTNQATNASNIATNTSAISGLNSNTAALSTSLASVSATAGAALPTATYATDQTTRANNLTTVNANITSTSATAGQALSLAQGNQAGLMGKLAISDTTVFDRKQSGYRKITTAEGVKLINLTGVTTANSPLSYNSSTQTVAIQQASGSQAGYLSASDWVTFSQKSATIQAATYAAAQTAVAALPAGVGAQVTIAADESPGNAGTGTGGANPTTYYLYFPATGLVQQLTY